MAPRTPKPAPKVRVRLTGWVVQPLMVTDDGETLTPFAVQPVNLGVGDLPDFVENVPRMLAQLQETVDGALQSADGKVSP